MADSKVSEQLGAAAARGDTAAVLRLLDAGAALDSKDSEGRTPLINAVSWGHTAAVRFLLERGADPSVRDGNGFTAADVAAMNDLGEIAALLQAHGHSADTATLHRRIRDSVPPHVSVTTLYPNAKSEKEVLIIASGHGDVDTVGALIKKGVPVDGRAEGGVTALMAVSTTPHADVARLLLDAGANANLKDDRGVTALMAAASANQLAIVRLLLQRGADSTLRANAGFTALDLAQKAGHGQAAAALQQAAASPGGKKSWWKLWGEAVL